LRTWEIITISFKSIKENADLPAATIIVLLLIQVIKHMKKKEEKEGKTE
jgi:hypothetical protein